MLDQGAYRFEQLVGDDTGVDLEFTLTDGEFDLGNLLGIHDGRAGHAVLHAVELRGSGA